MNHLCNILLIVFFLTFPKYICVAQVIKDRSITADFTIPDTVCVDQPVPITNLSQGATTYLWKFCSSSTTQNPIGKNIGNPYFVLNTPLFMTLVNDNGLYYAFITNMGDGSLARLDFGTNRMSNPVSGINFGNLGNLTTNARGIQIKKDNNNWYGFIVDANHIIRLNFGGSLANTPSVVDLGAFTALNEGSGLVILKDGGIWIGLCTSFLSNKLSMIYIGSSLTNQPIAFDLGNVGDLDHPFQFGIFKENGNWFMLICNAGSNSLSRLEFGNMLGNVPTGVNLGNIGGFEDNRGIVLSSDCDRVTGFVCEHTTNPNCLARLDFSSGISGPVVGVPIGNPGEFDRPSTFSEWIHVGDTSYTYVTNMSNSTLSLLYFPDCTDASIPSSTLKDPLPVFYSAPGIYTIKLIVDEGLATQQTICKQIVIIPKPVVDLGLNGFICEGTSRILVADSGFATYNWSTGDSTQSISVNTQGKYWVTVSNSLNCEASDTVSISIAQPASSSVDTSICFGQRYFAGGSWQSTGGIYQDSLQTIYLCDSIVMTHLIVKPVIEINLGRDSSICTGSMVSLNASIPGAQTYTWNDGSKDSINVIVQPGIYWVHVDVDNCMGGDTIRFGECPSKLWMPNAFTPNGDGRNDVFRPVGISITTFRMTIYDRWGNMVFETNDIKNGWGGKMGNQPCPAGVYSYIIIYEVIDVPGLQRKLSGSFTLVR
jgi:gliding motility-associated-like protein